MQTSSVESSVSWKTAILAMRPEMVDVAASYTTESAEDCVQDALTRAVDRVEQFRGQTEAQLRAWVRTIVRNTCISKLRRAGTVKFQTLSAAPEPAASLKTQSQEVRLNEERARLRELLATLTDAEQEAIFYRYFEGWTVKEIARQMQRSSVAVAGLLKRGVARLRKATSPSQWSQILR